MSVHPVVQLTKYIQQKVLNCRELREEYRYASLPLCVIDAVFSIGVKYKSTQNTVNRFCVAQNWQRIADNRYDRGKGEQNISDMLDFYREYTPQKAAEYIYNNTQLTSSKNGILKSEAVKEFCIALKQAGIENFEDVKNSDKCSIAEASILDIKGQGSGISFDYFKMLAGDDDRIKPDRQVQAFVQEALALNEFPSVRRTALLVKLAAKEIESGKKWTPLKLDQSIWQYQRNLKKTS